MTEPTRADANSTSGWRSRCACCDAADTLAMQHFRRDLVIETKPDRTFVTQADQAIERVIRERITATPTRSMAWSARSTGRTPAQGRVRWYIDPIDGTHNFMRGVPLFGTLLAAEVDGELVLGVMSAPALGTRWYARRGGGAWAVDALGPTAGDAAPIHVSGVRALADAQVVYASPLRHRGEWRGARVRRPGPVRLARSRLR